MKGFFFLLFFRGFSPLYLFALSDWPFSHFFLLFLYIKGITLNTTQRYVHNIWERNNKKKKYQESKCLARPIDRRRRGKEARSNLYVVLVCLGIIFIFFFFSFIFFNTLCCWCCCHWCVFLHSFSLVSSSYLSIDTYN